MFLIPGPVTAALTFPAAIVPTQKISSARI